jgi:hypothetical protein
MANETLDPPAPAAAASAPPELSHIARWVLLIAGAGILLISVASILAAAITDTEHLAQTTQSIFNALLPLFGTWVGTVLAYYFSNKNFESASKSVERMVNVTLEQKLGKLAVGKEMLQPGQITALQIPAGKAVKDILLTDVRAKLGGKITRLPILDSNGAVKYIVHQSGLFKFLAEQALAGKTAQISTLTLQDMVDDAELRQWVSNIAYVPETASVAEAKKQMELQPGCQDLIVTKTGAKDEPMLGWMTNVEIGRLSKA